MARTMAVVLFTDLVGSTELRGRLGEEAADELRRTHDRLLTEAVESHGGRVIKGLGDGIMATFVGASDAVAAAVAIQQAIDRLNRGGKAAMPLAVRVGLSAGDVTFEDDDVYGTPVVEAARLCGVAEGGQILAAGVVPTLAGLSDDELAERGRLELKGLQKPVPAWEVRWEPAAASTIPMPPLLTDVGRIFVGRDAELGRLQQLWKEAAAGERRVALLAGEPGVGKTRLAAELAIRVHDQGRVVLAGRCDEDLGVPYQPFVEALRHFVDHTPAADLKERLGRYAGELSRLVPELGERIPDLSPPLQSDPETERYRLFDAVAAWLSVASTEEPLLLVLDDLQWAAKPTLLLLRHIMRAADAKRLFILGTYRDTELTHDHPLVELVADLRREGAVERLLLSGLDDLGVAAIVEGTAGQALDEEGVALARAIYQETEGNPFFVREVLRHLVETNTIERDRGGWRTRVPIERLGIPEGIRDVVGRRLSRLSGSANDALRVAAVVGAEFEVNVVEAALELVERELLSALEEAVEARLVSEVSPTRFRFSHALVRATLYESLTGARKVALHRHVAGAIETVYRGRLDDFLPALARHWAKASAPADTARAVDYARRAGDRALTQLAHDEAAAYYRQALDLLDASADDALRCDLLISLGEAQRRAGDIAYRATLLDAARLAQRRGDADRLARAARGTHRALGFAGAGMVDDEIITLIEAALNAVGKADSAIRARLLAQLAIELVWMPQHERRRQLSDDAMGIARRLDDPETLAAVLSARYLAIWTPANVDERLANVDELHAVAERLDDPATTCQAWALRYRLMMETSQTAEAGAALDRFERLAGDLGQPTLAWMAAWKRAGWLTLAWRADEAEQLWMESLELGLASGQADAGSVYAVGTFPLRREQDRLTESEPLLSELTDRHLLNDLALAHALLALARSELGRQAEASSILQRLAETDFSALKLDFSWLLSTSVCAALVVNLADLQRAAVLYQMLLPYGDRLAFMGATTFGCVAHHLAMLATLLGRYQDAEGHFRAAQSTHDRIGAPGWLARSRLEWARMLLTRGQPGDAERARELLGQALATARDLGLPNVERQAVELLS